MRNASSYASSSSTNFAEYEDLPGHHLLSIRSLIVLSRDFWGTHGRVAERTRLFPVREDLGKD